jgi:type IV fimbrial biogenesis protein FimT
MTIVEVMIVALVLVVLVALAAPNLQEMIIRNRLDAATNDFVTALNLVRSEAIRRGGHVVIRRAAGSTSQEWTKGWEIFVDLPGGAGSFNNIRDAGEEVIRVGPALGSPLTLRPDRSTSDFAAFLPSGIASNFKPYVFVLCYGGQLMSNGRPRSRAVMFMGSSGRIRSTEPDGSGILLKDTATGTAAITSCSSP